jgi:hypothetical protein
MSSGMAPYIALRWPESQSRGSAQRPWSDGATAGVARPKVAEARLSPVERPWLEKVNFASNHVPT